MSNKFEEEVIALREKWDFITLSNMEKQLEEENNKTPSFKVIDKIAFVKWALNSIIN